MYVDGTKGSAALFALGLKIAGEHAETLKLRGLDPAATYAVKEINRGDRLHLDGGSCAVTATGRELMTTGIVVRLAGDYDSAAFEIERK